jgi:hypothetical protein
MSTAETTAANTAGTTSTSAESRYYDLFTTGFGYLNRPREVPVKKGSFLAVEINALRGEASNVEYTRFDCRVSGTEAQRVIREVLKPAIEAEKKVLVGFKIGDLYPTTFVYDKGKNEGKTGISLKAHLLRILWAKVDGVKVYEAPRENGSSGPAESTPAQAPAESQAE